MINIDFLQYLIEYSKTENLTRASKSLHVSQSALTRAMQKVEDYVGVPIFDRTKNRLSLNDTGKELVKNAIYVIEAEQIMKEKTVAFYNSKSQISIGSVAPGPMIKYGNLLYSIFPNKTIVTKIESEENLILKLKNLEYDFIFLSRELEDESLQSKFAFTEKLYIAIPKTHILAGMTNGIHFSEIDGQSFLVADNLGIWQTIVEKHLSKSKFFPQSFDNLNEIINSSTIPNFLTNITLSARREYDRLCIPILDDDASVSFYLVYRKDREKLVRSLFRYL